VAARTHQSLEVIDVLSRTFGHEVNGHYYLLKPGMVGVVRPGDHVRHLVPTEHDARVLLIWAPVGEAKRIIDYGTGTPIKALPQPIETSNLGSITAIAAPTNQQSPLHELHAPVFRSPLV